MKIMELQSLIILSVPKINYQLKCLPRLRSLKQTISKETSTFALPFKNQALSTYVLYACKELLKTL